MTADNTEKRQGQYDDLFKREKFETDFAFDSIWINGDTAVVRTHHHVGSVVTNFKEQKTIIDLNREVLSSVKLMVNGKFSFIPSTPTRFRAWHDYYKPGRPGLFIIYGAYYASFPT